MADNGLDDRLRGICDRWSAQAADALRQTAARVLKQHGPLTDDVLVIMREQQRQDIARAIAAAVGEALTVAEGVLRDDDWLKLPLTRTETQMVAMILAVIGGQIEAGQVRIEFQPDQGMPPKALAPIDLLEICNRMNLLFGKESDNVAH